MSEQLAEAAADYTIAVARVAIYADIEARFEARMAEIEARRRQREEPPRWADRIIARWQLYTRKIS